MKSNLEPSDEWSKYERGLDYNTRIDYYSSTDRNWNFYNGKHWEGITTNNLPTPVFNIARAAINYFTASIMSQGIKIRYNAELIPDEPTDEHEAEVSQFIDLMNGYAELKWEKDKIDAKLRKCLFDGANSGDFAMHVYWEPNIETGQDEKGDYVTEVVDGCNVMFGNPNCNEVEKQPYILVIGREMVTKLREEAKTNKISKDLIDTITSDVDYDYQIGEHGKYELDTHDDDGKCLYLIKYWKKGGEVYWNKSTKYCPIVKDEKVGMKKGEFTSDTKITRYPVAFANWESIKNSYHGMPVMKGIIPNQIVINQLFALVSYWMRMTAFGKVIYDSTKIASWTNQIGKAIPAQGDVTGIVQQLRAGDFNNGVLEVINLAIKYTKDFVGMMDAAIGNVKPDNTSAIIAVQKAAAVPLENIQANLYQFVEDLSLIWGEFILNKYINRKVSYRQGSQMAVGQLESEKYRDILLNATIDVGPSTHWSEVVSMQTLDNLLLNQKISIVQYLERMPNGIVPKKTELINEIKQEIQQAQMMEQQQAQMEQQQAAEEEEGQAREQQYEKMATFLDQVDPALRAEIMRLPEGQKEQFIQQLMTQGTI